MITPAGFAALAATDFSPAATHCEEATDLPVPIAEALMQRGMSDPTALKLIKDLSTEISPRLSGPEAEARACNMASKIVFLDEPMTRTMDGSGWDLHKPALDADEASIA